MVRLLRSLLVVVINIVSLLPCILLLSLVLDLDYSFHRAKGDFFVLYLYSTRHRSWPVTKAPDHYNKTVISLLRVWSLCKDAI